MMKKLTCLATALLAAVSASAASVYVSYYQDDTWHNSAYGYASPYNANLTGSPITITAINVPAGYHVIDWLTSLNANDIKFLDRATSTGVRSNTYTLSGYSTTANYYLAVRWYQVAYYLHYDTDGGTDTPPDSGPWYSQNSSATVGTYSGTKTGYTFSHWLWEAGNVSVANGEVFTGVTKFNLGNDSDVTINLKAVWTPNTHNCTFDLNGGSGGPAGPLTLTYGTGNWNDLSGALPTNAGHVFDGWYVSTYYGDHETTTYKAWNSDGSCAAGLIWDSSGNFNYDGEFTVYARWTPASYSLTTAASGSGSVSPSGTHSYSYGTQVALTATPNTGYLFGSWHDGSTENPRTVTILGDATYTAVFTQQVYNVTFWHYNSSAAWVSETQGVPYGENAVPPGDSAVNCPGRTFSGWQGSYGNVNSARDVTALYQVNNYNVLYDPNCEGSSGSMSPSLGQACYADWNLRQNQFSRPGYSFVEWNTEADGSGTRYGDGASVNNLAYGNGEYVTLYAQWAPITYAIAFSGGSGAEGEMAAIQSVAYDAEVALPANAFTKTGCEFLHWTLNGVNYDDGATVSNLTTTAGATVTLLAVWDAPFWIEFDANGGTGAMEVQRFESGEAKALYSNEYARDGYAFAGWATNAAAAAALNVKYADGEVVQDIGEVAETNTLFAVWSTNTYYVAFDANGGTGETMAPQRFVYDQAQNLTSNTYSRGELWRFGGWSNAVDDVVYADGAAVSNLCTEAEGTNTLFAVWKDNRSDLSKAMHCTNLQWTNVVAGTGSGNPWVARDDEDGLGYDEDGLGYESSGSCAEQRGLSYNSLTTAIVTNGVLSFMARNPSSIETVFDVTINRAETDIREIGDWFTNITLSADSKWYRQSVPIVLADISGDPSMQVYVHIACYLPENANQIVQIDQMTWVSEADKANAAAAAAVAAKIDAIGVVSYTDECKALIDDARAAYDLLTDDQKALVANYATLTAAEKSYADQAAADTVKGAIDAIGVVSYTDGSKALIDAARAAYDLLTDDQKALVTNYATLTAAEETYANLKTAAENQAAADPVIAKIAAIGEVSYTDASKALIDAARAAYDLLTDDQKALVANYATLTAAEETYANLKTAAENQAAADSVIAKIAAIGEVSCTDASKALIDAARAAYDLLTDDQKALVTNYATLTAAEAEYAALKAAADSVVGLIAAIGEVSYTDASKEKIDAARAAYDALTGDQKALVANYATLTTAESTYKAHADQAAADTVRGAIDAIGVVSYTDGSKALIDAARAAYDLLTDDQKALVTNYATLTAAEAEYAALKTAAENQAAADPVKGAIDAIGEVAYTDASKALIDAARAAYDLLTDDQKALVTNYATLTAAEETYANLKTAAENQAAADSVKGAIDAIGVVSYTDGSKALVDAARAAYDLLTDGQKALVTNYGTLTAAEAEYAALKTAAENQAAADSVIGLIDAIGVVSYMDASKAKIEAARAAYDALTDAQKALVTNYATLTTAEAAYAELAPELHEETSGTIDLSVASTWDGYLRDGSGGVKGSVQVKIGKANKNTGKSKVTLTAQMADGTKRRAKGVMSGGVFVDAASGTELNFGADAMRGRVGGHDVDGSRNVFAAKDPASKAAAAAALSAGKGAYVVAWEDGAGYAVATVSVSAKGKAKATVILAKGTKVSASGQLAVGDSANCVFLVSKSRKTPLAFNLWLTGDGLAADGFGGGAVVARAGALGGGKSFVCPFLAASVPVTVNGNKWTVATDKATALKLTYTPKTGAFKGSFKVGRQKATVNGVVVDGKGYGSAVIRNVGSAAVTVE